MDKQDLKIETIEDAKKWIESINTFDTKGGLTSRASLLMKKNSFIMDIFKKILNIDSDNPSELIYKLYNPDINGICQVCGKPTKFVSYTMGYRKTCCRKCADVLTVNGGKITKQEKYGDPGYSNVEKRKQTNLEKYGNPYYVNHEKAIQTRIERYGSTSYNNYEQYKTTCLTKYGVDNYAKTQECLTKMKATNFIKTGFEYACQSEESKKKLIQNSHKKYLYDNIYFDSTWELAFYIVHKDAGHIIEREPINFEYNVSYTDEVYHYFPDFRVDGKLYEMKGPQLLAEDGTWLPYYPSIKNVKTPIDLEHLYERAKNKGECAKNNGVIVIDKNGIRPYSQYCKIKFNNNTWYKQFKVNSKTKDSTLFNK